MPPPSSGGIHIIEILNILSQFDMHQYGFGSADAMQLMAEAEKRAYADRSEYRAIRLRQGAVAGADQQRVREVAGGGDRH